MGIIILLSLISTFSLDPSSFSLIAVMEEGFLSTSSVNVSPFFTSNVLNLSANSFISGALFESISINILILFIKRFADFFH